MLLLRPGDNLPHPALPGVQRYTRRAAIRNGSPSGWPAGCRKLIEPIKLALRESVLDDDVPSLDITKLAQPTLKFIVVGQWPR